MHSELCVEHYGSGVLRISSRPMRCNPRGCNARRDGPAASPSCSQQRDGCDSIEVFRAIGSESYRCGRSGPRRIDQEHIIEAFLILLPESPFLVTKGTLSSLLRNIKRHI